MNVIEKSPIRSISSRTMPLLLAGTIASAIALGSFAAYWPAAVVMLPLVILLVVALVLDRDFCTLVVIFILYSNAAAVAVRFHGVPYVIGSAVPLLLLYPVASYLIKERQNVVVSSALSLMFVFLLIQVLGTLFSEDVSAAVPGLMTFVVEGLVIYILITNAIRTPVMLRRVIWTLLATGAFMGALSLYQQLTGTFSNNYWGFAQMTSEGFRTGEETIAGEVIQPRLAGPIGEQNRYAQVLLMLLPLSFFQLVGGHSRWLRSLAVGSGILITLGMVTTFSRGATVGLLVLLAIMGVMRYIKLYQVAITLVGLLLLVQVFPQLGTRVASLDSILGVLSGGTGTSEATADGALTGRANTMTAAWLTFADHPVIGVGPYMFAYHYPEYAEAAGGRVLEGNWEAHNLYLAIAADTGLLGLLCFCAILVVTLRDLVRIRKQIRSSNPEFAYMATGLMLAIITYMATGMFLHFSYPRFFWIIMAVAGAAACIFKQEAAERKAESDRSTDTIASPHRASVVPQ